MAGMVGHRGFVESVKWKRVMNPQEVEATGAVFWHAECTITGGNEGRL
jgi:hypothetical protein